MINSSEFAEKWNRRLKGATEDVRRGVERVTEAPGVKAAAKQEKMKTRLNASIDDGTWGKNVSGVSLSEWKDKFIKKGIGRISSGVDGATDKMKSFANELLSHEEAGKAIIDKMPDISLEDSKARASAWIDHMAKFRYKK